MASDAEAILSHPRSGADVQLDGLTFWIRTHGPLLLLSIGAFTFAYTILSGLRLFDNDYDWINQARETGWFQILGEILRPIPERWGFQDRPVQIFGFKILHSLFGHDPSAYYVAKAVLFAGVCLGIARFSITLGLSHGTALLAAAVFALASPGQASALWVSDFELLAEILILATFGVFWHLLNSEETSRGREIANQVLLTLLAVVAHRTKGSAKLIPAIILLYLFLYRRDQLRRFAPGLGLICLTIVPIFTLVSEPIPPFAPFAEDQSQGWMWKPANLATFSTLLAGNFHPIWGTSGPDTAFSILSVLTPAMLWPSAAAAVFLAWRSRASYSTPAWRFVGIWSLVSLAAYASFPRLPDGFMARYVVVALVPISTLVGTALTSATRSMRRGLITPALASMLALHGAHNLQSTRDLRDTLGQVIVAYDLSREHLATQVSSADVVIIGFDYSYNRKWPDENRYHRETLTITETEQARPLHVLVRADQNVKNIDHRPLVQQIRRALVFPRTTGAMKVAVKPPRIFTGLTDSFYDTHVYKARQSFAGVLYEVIYGQEDS